MMNLDQPWLNKYELEPYLLYHAAQLEQYRLKEVQVTKVYHGKKLFKNDSYNQLVEYFATIDFLAFRYKNK